MKLIEDNTTITNELELVILFTLFRMVFFVAAHGWGEGQKDPPPQNLSHISYNNETCCSYTLLREDPKDI